MTKDQVKAIVQFFQGCYPNTEFVDSVISAGAWYQMLKDYDYDDIMIACREIVKTQENGYKVNIAAVIQTYKDQQRQKREYQKMIDFQKRCDELEKNKCDPKVAEYYIKRIKDFFAGKDDLNDITAEVQKRHVEEAIELIKNCEVKNDNH